jgi:predicted SAM-dependent methyltransferase
VHPDQQRWCESVKSKFREYFINKKVLDVGSLDINGNNRYLFENCEYTGLDIIKGENVDIISIAHEYNPHHSFDVVLSTNALEHDMYYSLTLKKMYDLLKSEGLLFFSVASLWKEHGTQRSKPKDSPTSSVSKDGWNSYYKNLTENDIKLVFDLKNDFNSFEMKVSKKDLQFWGIKK